MSRTVKIALGIVAVLAVLWYMGRRNAAAIVTPAPGAAAGANNTAGIVGQVAGGIGTIISAFRPGPVQG